MSNVGFAHVNDAVHDDPPPLEPLPVDPPLLDRPPVEPDEPLLEVDEQEAAPAIAQQAPASRPRVAA